MNEQVSGSGEQKRWDSHLFAERVVPVYERPEHFVEADREERRKKYSFQFNRRDSQFKFTSMAEHNARKKAERDALKAQGLPPAA